MVQSPCVENCQLDLFLNLCIGCGRTKEELSNWYKMTDEEKLAVLELLKGRGYGPI